MNKEDIYNTWLKVTARYNNRPYKKRVNFDTLKEDDKVSLDKLYRIFNNFPGLNMERYFSAGYELYGNDFEDGKAFIPLCGFATAVALKNYTIFSNSLSDKKMTDKSVMQDILNGFLYIKSKCENNSWKLSHYIGSCDDKLTYEWILDYADHKISPYNIVAFDLIGFDTSSAVRKTVPTNETEVFFNGKFEDKVLSLIDKMTEDDKKLLIGILKKFNAAIAKAVDNK